jgi:hypothetical protein
MISRYADNQTRNELIKKFHDQCTKDLLSHNFKNTKYFERLNDSFERDNFLNAIKSKTTWNTDKMEILIPHASRLQLKDTATLYEALAVYIVGNAIFFVALIFPGYNTMVPVSGKNKK